MQVLKTLPVLFALLTFSINISAQERPQLVVGIIVDQMRYDYLYRYWEDMGENGIKRLVREGHVVHDGHYQYVPTFTAPGHASVYTGTGPALHGIIGNDWYSRQEKKSVYCAGDPDANTVGSSSAEGKMSPHRLRATTIADQLELATNRRSKTIGIAIKDRGGILPVGQLADGAYWFDKTEGRFITSDFYREALPGWVDQFNSRELPRQYLEQTWTTLLPMERYDESLPDDRSFERPYYGIEKAVFPYDLKKLVESRKEGDAPFGLLPATPFGNTYTTEFAKAAIVGEQMGQDAITDLLAVSYSSTDYVGHQFGPHSVEIQDTYLRLDREIEDLLNFLDEKVGLKNTLIFLTADHAGADVPGYIPNAAGYFKSGSFQEGLRKHLKDKYKTDPIAYYINQQIYFTRPWVADPQRLASDVRAFAANFAGVHSIVSLRDLAECNVMPGICDKIIKGYMPDRSGDLYVLLYPGWLPDYTEKGGTTHGSPYSYDTHVPIIFYGWGVAPGNNYSKVWIEDIAPTVCQLLKISLPSGCSGSPVVEVFEK